MQHHTIEYFYIKLLASRKEYKQFISLLGRIKNLWIEQNLFLMFWLLSNELTTPKLYYSNKFATEKMSIFYCFLFQSFAKNNKQRERFIIYSNMPSPDSSTGILLMLTHMFLSVSLSRTHDVVLCRQARWRMRIFSFARMREKEGDKCRSR